MSTSDVPNRPGDSRWVMWPDPNPDDRGYRACMVVENEEGFQRYGRVSNDPAAPSPIYIGKTEEEAQRWCYEWNKDQFGYSEEEQRLIVLSSMRRQPVKAVYDDEADRFTILRCGEEVLTLESDECEDLMRQLYKLRWPYDGPECIGCGEPLVGFECVNRECPECPSSDDAPEEDEAPGP